MLLKYNSKKVLIRISDIREKYAYCQVWEICKWGILDGIVPRSSSQTTTKILRTSSKSDAVQTYFGWVELTTWVFLQSVNWAGRHINPRKILQHPCFGAEDGLVLHS